MCYNAESIAIYNKLCADLSSFTGGIQFKLGDSSFAIQSKDGIGGMIQEWLGIWAINHFFNISCQVESQEFPDFYVGEESALLEIKTYDANAGANFDIANFQSYCESLATNPERLNADYLIFAYVLNNGILSIRNIFLKKVWEISSASERWPIKTQTKRDIIYNLRPCSFYSVRSTYPPFQCKEDFVNALYKTEAEYLRTEMTENAKKFFSNTNNGLR